MMSILRVNHFNNKKRRVLHVFSMCLAISAMCRYYCYDGVCVCAISNLNGTVNYGLLSQSQLCQTPYYTVTQLMSAQRERERWWDDSIFHTIQNELFINWMRWLKLISLLPFNFDYSWGSSATIQHEYSNRLQTFFPIDFDCLQLTSSSFASFRYISNTLPSFYCQFNQEFRINNLTGSALLCTVLRVRWNTLFFFCAGSCNNERLQKPFQPNTRAHK